MTVATINVAIYLLYITFYYEGKAVRVWLRRPKLFSSLGLN